MMNETIEKVHPQNSSLEVEHRKMKGKTAVMEAPLIEKKAAIRDPGGHSQHGATRMKRGVNVIDFVLRLFTLVAALVATIIMGTTEQTLPFFTQFFQFRAKYYDLPTFTYFVITNGIVSAYLVLSLPFSIVTIGRPHAKAPRLLLLTLDTIAMTLTTSGAAAGAAIVYLAHKGNVSTNWIAICQQFDRFCQRSSGAVIASFTAATLLILMTVVSTVTLKS